MSETTRVVEINGVKLELDLRQATLQSIDAFKVGDSVKVLVKVYEGYESHAGVIVGFDAFKSLPTIIIAYLKVEYQKAALRFVYLNSATKDVEVCPASTNDVPFERDSVLGLMDRAIELKQVELAEAVKSKELFLQMFNRYFADYAQVVEQVDAV
jgi:hypothetical protein